MVFGEWAKWVGGNLKEIVDEFIGCHECTNFLRRSVFNHNTKISSHFFIPEESNQLYFQCGEVPAE